MIANLARLALVTLLSAAVGGIANAQSASQQIAAGDRAHDARRPSEALAYYEAVLSADPASYDALWRASREAVDLGEAETAPAKRSDLFTSAEDYGRRAVAANPNDAEGHFALARALGRTALTLGSRQRVRYAAEVRDAALSALELNPTHAGALHVMGVWNAEIMRLGRLERFFARNLLGGGVFSQASWNEAARYLERAVALEPERITHRVALARVYIDLDSVERAREQLVMAEQLPLAEFNDAAYKREAAELLASLR